MIPTPYREFRPSPRLARYVECYWSRGGEGLGHSILPDGCADILFTTEPVRLALVGLMTRPLPVESVMGQCYFGVRFRPGMAAAFVPEAATLSDRIEPLESMWGAVANQLRARLTDAQGPLQMIDIMERSLRPLEPADPARRVLWHMPDISSPLKQLIRDAGLSERHFRRSCTERTGVSPIYLRRILRFRGAVDRIRASAANGAQPSWAHLAAACHYYDQAHLIHDFEEFAGCTPGRFLQSLRTPEGVKSKNHEPAETRKSNRLY